MRLVGIQLSVLLLLALGLPGVSAAQEEQRVCEPPSDCLLACRIKARALLWECIANGNPIRECGSRAKELRRACIVSECEPRLTCEERCKRHGMRLLRRCLEAGGGLDRCRMEAQKATESCIEEECRDCSCPDVYDPVCGVDGMTYGNACEAACANVQIRHEGPCEPKCPPLPCEVFCPYGHVIGPDGCPTCDCNPPPGCQSDADCDDDQVCRQLCSLRPCIVGEPCPPCVGVCVPRTDPCACPDIYDPVCGVDGMTYSNACQARCAGVAVLHDGVCRDCGDNGDCDSGEICFPPTHLCQPECAIQCFLYDPVCGEDGVTYGCGVADAHCHGVEVAHAGECLQPCPINQTCEVVPQP